MNYLQIFQKYVLSKLIYIILPITYIWCSFLMGNAILGAYWGKSNWIFMILIYLGALIIMLTLFLFILSILDDILPKNNIIRKVLWVHIIYVKVGCN